MKNKIILILLFLIQAYLLSAQTNQNNRTLKVAIEGDIDFFSPWDSTYSIRTKTLSNIFESLVALDERSTKIKPMLATSWKITNNNRTWTFKLRKGMKFHDGSTLTADDVVASASLFREFDAIVEKVDRYTVRFNLPEPHSGFLNRPADISYSIAPSHTINQYKSLKKDGKLENFIPIGSGPFRFSRHEKGKQVILESFTDYWQGSPWLKKLIYYIIPDNNVRIKSIERGDIDVLDVILPANIVMIKNNPNLKIISRFGLNLSYLSMNTTRKPLDNVKVRQAISLSIDKMRLAQMFYYGGYGVPTNRLLSPAFWGFTALPSPGRYQPSLAKRMLAEAGYRDSLTFKMVCIPVARPYPPDPKTVAEEIKRQLAAVGVRVNIIIPADFAEYDSILRSRDYDMVLTSWINHIGDPNGTLYPLLSGKEYIYNNARWHNKQFDEKLKAARELPFSNVRGRIRLYNEVQNIVQKEVPLIPLIHTKIFVIHNRKVRGIILYPSTMVSYHKVRFES